MSCPNGQIQIGFNPATMQPVCIDESMINNSSSGIPLTGATMSSGNGNWWNQVLDSIPGVLTGVADVIGASKGNAQPDNITIVQSPVEEQRKSKFPIGWLIALIVIVAIVIMVLFIRKKKV